MPLSTDEVLELMQSVAAEVITPRFRSLTEAQIDEKKPGDLVTVADHEAEEQADTDEGEHEPSQLPLPGRRDVGGVGKGHTIRAPAASSFSSAAALDSGATPATRSVSTRTLRPDSSASSAEASTQ